MSRYRIAGAFCLLIFSAANAHGAICFDTTDNDGDGVPDRLDNCPSFNPDQRDTNLDGLGNICDADLDNDGDVDADDEAILMDLFFTSDPDADFNGDGIVNFLDLNILESLLGLVGPVVPVDIDGDGILNINDVCTIEFDDLQMDTNGDGYGNRCDPDIGGPGMVGVDDGDVNFSDLGFEKSVFFTNPGDCKWNPDANFGERLEINFVDLGIMKSLFFCPPGPSCQDLPAAARGAFCVAPDGEGDGIPDYIDNCPADANVDQVDLPDGDGMGNACDTDDDDDTFPDVTDNCTLVATLVQLDTDMDGFGNACDPDLNNDWLVNNNDLAIFNAAFGSVTGDLNWNEDADFDGDGDVDDADTSVLMMAFFGPPGPSLPVDADSDGRPDQFDNCLTVANPEQRNTDNDAFGNFCDPDLDNNNLVNFADQAIMAAALPSVPGDANWDPDADLDGNMMVDDGDLCILGKFFGLPPGP